MLERHRQREIRDVETAEQREERLKIMRERPIAMETAEQSDLPAKVFNIRVFPTCLYW